MPGLPHKSAGLLLAALLAVLLVAPAAARAEQSVENWLERMAHAVSGLDYRGTLVTLHGGEVNTLRIIHRVDADGVRERIYALDGKPREILRDRDSVQCLLADSDTVVVPNQFPTRLLPRLPIDEVADRDEIYALEFAGTDRVAGLDARIIEISPKDGYRYGHRLWLEEQTGMLLRSALLDDDGEIIQQLSFVAIELGARITDAELEPGFDRPDRVASFTSEQPDAGSEDSQSRQPSWMPEKLPAGFQLASVGRSTGPSGKPVEHLLFSDGLASFSVYIETVGDKSVVSAIESMGPVHVYTGKVGDQLVTVVGEVPASTVARIGRHLRRAANPVLRHFP